MLKYQRLDTYLRSGDFLCFFADLIQFCCLQPVISFQGPRNLKVLSLLMQTQKVVGNVDFLKLCYMILQMNYVCNGYKMMIDHRKL